MMISWSPRYYPFQSLIAFLALSLIFFIPKAMAIDYLIGHVVSLDRENREFVLRVANNPELPRMDDQGAKIKEYGTLITVILTKASIRPFLPGSVQEGELVRVWGAYDEENSTVFRSVDIRGTRGWSTDMTGVRRRLGKGGEYPHNGPGLNETRRETQ